MVGRKFTILLCFTLYARANSKYKPLEGLIFRVGDLTEGFCVTVLGGLYLEGLIHGGAYIWNFTVHNILVVS